MSKPPQIRIGESLEEVGQRFVEALHRAERGELTDGERHISSENLATYEAWKKRKRQRPRKGEITGPSDRARPAARRR
jgi:hypothetical protein